jgi:hypothetical protein
MPIRFDASSPITLLDERDDIGVNAEEMIALFSRFGRVGSWRLDIDSSQYEVSRGGFEIYGIEYKHSRASLIAFRERIHPDDLDLLAEALTTASVRQCSFSLIYRIKNDGCHKYVRTIGAFRAIEGTSGELFGITYEMRDHVRELLFDT